ncbi:unnamed protein product, partial [Laminaria digitata]
SGGEVEAVPETSGSATSDGTAASGGEVEVVPETSDSETSDGTDEEESTASGGEVEAVPETSDSETSDDIDEEGSDDFPQSAVAVASMGASDDTENDGLGWSLVAKKGRRVASFSGGGHVRTQLETSSAFIQQ